MHLVVHSTYGSRINRAWGLALRKRFCRTFNFELQAAAWKMPSSFPRRRPQLRPGRRGPLPQQ